MNNFADIALVPQAAPAVWRRHAAPKKHTSKARGAPYTAWLRTQPVSAFQSLNNAYISTYGVKEVLTGGDAVKAVFADFPMAQLFDVAHEKGINCLGVAPAHKRKGEFVYPTPSDAPRVYQDRGKRPHYTTGTLSVAAFEAWRAGGASWPC